MNQHKLVGLHMSDTHGLQSSLTWDIDWEGIDMVAHSGDFTNVGEEKDVVAFFDWFSNLPVKYKVCTAGNHDKSFDPKFWYDGAKDSDRYKKRIAKAEEWLPPIIDALKAKEGCFFLNHELVEIDGFKIFGSPWSVSFHEAYWAFNLKEGPLALNMYSDIPEDVDLLITHGPAFGRLDRTSSGINTGSEILAERIKVTKPQYHLCGHIHEAYGMSQDDDTTYLNSSILNIYYEQANEPQKFELTRPK